MGHHSCCNKQKVRRGLWSPEEDEKLMKYVSTHGHGCWSSVPKLAGLQRCGKSCRLRWINYLRPDLKRGNFSRDEESLIVELHRLLGNRWAQIAKHLPGRTDNEVKNFWNSTIKKKLISRAFNVLDFPSRNNSLLNAQAHPSDLFSYTQDSFFLFSHNDGREMEIKMDLPIEGVDFDRMTTPEQAQAFPYNLSFPYQTEDGLSGQEISVNSAITEDNRLMNPHELGNLKGTAKAEDSYCLFPCFPSQVQACNLQKLSDQAAQNVEKLLVPMSSSPPSAPISYCSFQDTCSVIW